jgi:hypothetical protein
MSMISRTRYESAAEQFFRNNPREFEKYFSKNLLQTLVNAMITSLPTVTAARIAFDRLVAEGKLLRTDGKSNRDDQAQAVAAAEANLKNAIAKVDAQPLTRNELEHFSSLSHRELSRLYWGPNGDGMTEFAVRYRKSCKEFGFVVPPKFSDEAPASGEIGLTPEQYRAMPSAELKRRLREPRFKLQVWQLIKAGQI